MRPIKSLLEDFFYDTVLSICLLVFGPECKSLIRSAQQKSVLQEGLLSDAMAQTFEIPYISSYCSFLFLKDTGHFYVCKTSGLRKLMFQRMPYE